MLTIPKLGNRGQLNVVIPIIVGVAILIVMLNIGLSVFSGFNTEANYNSIPISARSAYDLVPTAFGFALVLVIILLILGILSRRSG